MAGTVQNKKKLFIIGAGGLGREIESWLEYIPENNRDWELEGYLDINNKSLNMYPSDYKVISSEKDYIFKKDSMVLIAISNPKKKEEIYNVIKKMNNIKIMTLIAPSATIGKFCVIGEGSIICPNVIITTNVQIGKAVLVNCGSQIGHDVSIGDFSTINANVDIAGKCMLGTHVLMGSNSVIIPGKKIYNDVTIGAGSVVIRNINRKKTLFGNPAIDIN